MTTLVLLVLAGVWGVVILSALRSRAQATFGDPVGTFRRHLTVLEHTAPSVVPAANRLRPYIASGSGMVAAGAIAPYRASEPNRRTELSGNHAPTSRGSGRGPANGARGARAAGAVAAGSMRRRQAVKRRRDVFFALVAGAIGSLLLGLVPGLHVMLVVQVIFDLLLVSYVGLLVRMRNLAAERDLKLTYLSAAHSPAAHSPGSHSSAGRSPATVRQPAATRFTPGRGYDVGGYGQLAVRRVAAN